MTIEEIKAQRASVLPGLEDHDARLCSFYRALREKLLSTAGGIPYPSLTRLDEAHRRYQDQFAEFTRPFSRATWPQAWRVIDVNAVEELIATHNEFLDRFEKTAHAPKVAHEVAAEEQGRVAK
jgi:hypothetical protein